LISGRIINIDNRGNLIARSKKTPKEGARVLDKKRDEIGTVVSIIGPAEKPYLVIKPKKGSEKRMLGFVNEEVFIDTSKKKR
jgi:rRNA processing protein Gar1